MILSYNPREIWPFIRTNMLISVLIRAFFCFSCFFNWSDFVSTLDDFVYTFLITCFLSGGISEIISFSDRKFSWLEKPFKRLLFDITAVVGYTFIVSFLLASIFCLYVWKYFTLETFNFIGVAKASLTPIYISLGITTFFTSRSFLIEWKQAAIETEKMKNEQLASKYQGLKDQLNPHFLFNSLNVLSNLVYEDADKANTFIEKLSRIYRYVLDVQHEEFVALDKELEFARSFLDLQKTRFGDKFQFSINLDSTKDYALPPLTLQLLLENAFKHNKATREKPMLIEISLDGDVLRVQNTLQAREGLVNSSGIGLKNINERSKILTQKEISVEVTEERFSVAVPLLKLNQ